MPTSRLAARDRALRDARRYLGVEVEYRSQAPTAPAVTVKAILRRAVGVTGEYGQVVEVRDTVSLVPSDLPATPAAGEELIIRDGGEELRVIDKVLQQGGNTLVVSLRRFGA